MNGPIVINTLCKMSTHLQGVLIVFRYPSLFRTGPITATVVVVQQGVKLMVSMEINNKIYPIIDRLGQLQQEKAALLEEG